MQRSLGIVAALGLTVIPLLAASQSPPSGTRSREGFAGNLEVMSKGAPESAAVDYRTWFVPEGTTLDNLASCRSSPPIVPRSSTSCSSGGEVVAAPSSILRTNVAIRLPAGADPLGDRLHPSSPDPQ